MSKWWPDNSQVAKVVSSRSMDWTGAKDRLAGLGQWILFQEESVIYQNLGIENFS